MEKISCADVGDNDGFFELKVNKEPCLEIFMALSDTGKSSSACKCGLPKGHYGNHAWRGDLPGGPVEPIHNKG